MNTPDQEMKRLAVAIAFNRDEGAYKQLFHLLYPSLKRFAAGILKDAELAEEIAGDVMIALWRNHTSLLDIGNIKVYAIIMAKNRCLDILRKQKREPQFTGDADITLIPDTYTPEQVLITTELRTVIQEGINTLPPQCKLVFHLIKEEKLSYKEAAEILNISAKTVDAHLVTAIKKIAHYLKSEYNLTH